MSATLACNSSSESLENLTVVSAGEHICHSDCSEYSDSEAAASSALIRTPRKMEARNDHQRHRQFDMLQRFNIFVGALMVALVAVWCTHFRGGFAWQSNITLQFNWHPMLMTLGMIFTFAQSMLIYRSKRRWSKKILKWTHASLHGIIFICTVVGLKAVFDFHNYNSPTPIANLYSMHSWIGLTAVIIFSFQYVLGFGTFLWPGLRQEIRKFSLPIHVATGTACFFFCVCAAFMGFTEKAIFAIKDYKDLEGEALLVNFIGILLAIFGALSLYLVTNADYKREADGEEHIIITEHTE